MRVILGPGKLGPGDGPDAQMRLIVVLSVRKLDVVAVIGGLGSDGAQDIALRADLPAAARVGRHGLVDIRQVIDGDKVRSDSSRNPKI